MEKSQLKKKLKNFDLAKLFDGKIPPFLAYQRLQSRKISPGLVPVLMMSHIPDAITPFWP